jgi:hypothetical protein
MVSTAGLRDIPYAPPSEGSVHQKETVRDISSDTYDAAYPIVCKKGSFCSGFVSTLVI